LDPTNATGTKIGEVTATQAIRGDTSCGSGVNSIDALQVLRKGASLSPYGACVNVAGDVDCTGTINAIDALKILRHSASLSVSQQPGCTPVGDPMP
jgi:hypothetical protein